jgi:hypothetical protein
VGDGTCEVDFIDEDGNPLATFELIAGRLWASRDENAKFGQFPEADLTNFHNSFKLLSRRRRADPRSPAALPVVHGDNPASADAIRRRRRSS